MHRRNVKFVVPLAIASAAALAVCTGLASASGASNGGVVHAYEADSNQAGSVGTVVLTGAITDSGTDQRGAGPGGTNLFVLSKGSFAVDISDVGNQFNSLPDDPRTCSSGGTVRGPITIVAGTGTGAYAGISGTLETTASTAFIVPRNGNDGRCNWNATQYPGVLIANASGTATYGN